MSTQTNAVPSSSLESQAVAARIIPETRQFYWAVRREFWENRAIYFAPLAVAGVALFGFLVSLAHLPRKMRAASTLDAMERHRMIEQPYDFAAALLMATFLIVAVFYCIEALQKERRDRSILFWKSLPVPDRTTVLAKASIPFVALPLLCCAMAMAIQFIMLVAGTAVLAGSGENGGTYWSQVPFAQMSLLLVYHVMTVHVLGTAPVYGWLLLVSAWARRAAFLWAVLPPLAICALEKLVFNTAHFGAYLAGFLSGDGMEAVTAPNTMPMDPSTHLTPLRFLGSAELWTGLAVTAAFLFAATRLRRYRGPN